MKIGITVGFLTADESIWVNGIKQNAFFLMKTLRAAFPDADVCLANTTAVDVGQTMWNGADIPLYALNDIISELDLLVVLGGAITQQQTDAVKRQGGKVVGYKCGSEYVVSMEAVMFNRQVTGEPYYNRGFDALWIIPQVAEINAPFYEVMHRIRSQVVPFIWDPCFLEAAASVLPEGGLYRPGRTQKRITIMEPNADVLKYFLYPLMLVEKTYRTGGGEWIDFVSVTNTQSFRTHREFLGVVSHIDLVRDRKCYFENRFETAWFLANHSDVVVSHQWGNPLNYAYLEACWLGYPLVHNAELLMDAGYYYPGFSIDVGADRLKTVLQSHDQDADGYLARQRSVISRFLADNQEVVSTYRRLVIDVMQSGETE